MGLSRQELFGRLGLVQLVDPVTEAICIAEEQEIYDNDLGSSPHGQPWHTSFHGSAFPGDDEKACARKALYGLMNIPSAGPANPRLRAQGDVGKAVEVLIVERWERAGILLSAPPTEPVQTGFSLPEYWLTCSTDAIIKPPGWNRGHVVEVKSKSDQVLKDMKYGRRSYDPSHRNQLLCTVAMANLFSPSIWPHLEPVVDGTIYYVSRENPRNTMEFFFELDESDESFFNQGLETLEQWREFFKAELLPERDPDWRWTEQPCQYCAVKKLCKADHKAKVRNLRDSKAVEFAKSVRSGYSYEDTRRKVIERWET